MSTPRADRATARRSRTGAGCGAAAPNVDVAVTADADAFLQRLVERVGALAASVADGPG